ncbi:hypothetical protein RB195_003643 [Necator americanus]|uniref:G-protein coupled receptors family 3 profile domain-containing protein n=1 Tax=Necator americanus TaxID=51031 RepID=A0ABR1DPH3_NECAM
MPCQAVHSQLLFVLLTCYCNLTFYLLLARQHSIHILSVNASEVSTKEVTMKVEGFKVFISLIIYILSILCIICCIMINNVDRMATKVPSAVIVAILIFVLLFNVMAMILLFIHNGPNNEKVTEIRACAILSTPTAVLIMVTLGYFAWKPPTTALIIHDYTKNFKQGTKKKSNNRHTVIPIPKAFSGESKEKNKSSDEEKHNEEQPQYENLVEVNQGPPDASPVGVDVNPKKPGSADEANVNKDYPVSPEVVEMEKKSADGGEAPANAENAAPL